MKRKTWIYSLIAVAVFAGASFTVTVIKIPFTANKEFKVDVAFAGIKPVMAAQTTWAGVRSTATFMRNTARGVDTLITSLNSSGVLNQSGTVGPFTSGNNRFRLTTGAAVANDATGATPTYAKLFQVCVGSSLAMELYLTSASDPAANNGAVIVWQPKLFDSSLSSSANLKCSFGTGASLGASANGKKAMVCSWNTATTFDGATTGPIVGRIMAVDDTAANQILMMGVANLNGSLACTGTNDQYTLAYIADKTSPHNTTAKWGWNDIGSYSAANFDRWCAVASSNTTNAGAFNTTASGYFVGDGYTDGTLPSGFPTVTAVSTLIANEATTMNSLPGAAIAFPSGGTAPACPF